MQELQYHFKMLTICSIRAIVTSDATPGIILRNIAKIIYPYPIIQYSCRNSENHNPPD